MIARRDLIHSTRTLLRSPGFTLTAILLVTIGIGANIAVFTLANFVLLRPLPFPEPNRLMRVWEKHPGYNRMELSPANYRDVKSSSNSFTALAAYNGNAMSLVGQGEPQRVEGSSVTANLFSVLETRTLIGRTFQEKGRPGGRSWHSVLSYSLWQTAFGGDQDIVGKAVSLDDQPYTVIGVMPHDFRFPTRANSLLDTFSIQRRGLQGPR